MPEDGVRALRRALDLLEVMRESPITLTDLAGRCRLSKSTTHRLLSTLKSRGYVAQERDSEMYRLGLSLLGLGSAVASRSDLLRNAYPVMRQLAAATGESIRLGVPHQDEIILVHHVEDPKSLWSAGPVFMRLPMHCTALGKVILASLPPAEVDRIAREKGLARYGPNSVDDLTRLKAGLERVRQQGYAVNDEEHFAGERAAAAPIRDAIGSTVAGLVLIGPAHRVTIASLSGWGGTIQRGADAISRALGWTGVSNWSFSGEA